MSQRAFDREAQRRERAQARRTNLRRRRAGLAAGAVGAAVLFAPSAASAAPFEVNTVADNGPGDCNTTCTLRDAIALANANGEADTITFSSAVTGAPDPTIYLVDGQLQIDSAITITGPGADDLSISGKTSAGGSSNSRIFLVTGGGDARISGLTLTHGNGGADGGSDGFGGAIASQGKLTLTDSIVTGNSASGGMFAFASGGGISVSSGEALVDSTEVTENYAQSLSASGGGLVNNGGTMTVRDSSVTDNEASGEAVAFGGGITGTAATNVESTHVDNNFASGGIVSGGGGISANDAKYPDDIFLRSGRAAGPNQLRITDSTVNGNEADFGGGVSADFSQNKYLNSADGVTIVRTTIDGNTATEAGGGLAVSNQSDGNDVTVRDTTVSNNHVQQEKQEVPARGLQPDPSGTGGGIDFGGESEGDSLVSNSTISGNSAAEGGGIHAGSTTSVSSRAERGLENSPSLSRLLEQAEQDAPADESEPRGTTTTEEPPPPPATTGSLVVSNTTVASNNAADTGGGVAVDPSATDQASTKLSSTIVGNNNANGAPNDLATSGEEGLDVGYSLIEQAGSAAVTPIAGQPNVNGKDPALGGLANNGGPTLTHLPAGSSPAIDAGIANGLATDQRGLPRTQDRLAANVADGTDIGAVEIPGESPATPGRPVTPSSTPTICGRRAISLVRADLRGKKVKLTGLVGSKFYGKSVTIQTDPKGARNSKFTKTGTVKASSTGAFSVSVPKPAADDIASVRYRAVIGSAKSPALKLPQSLTSRSVKSAKGTITVKGKVKLSVLGKRNKVKIRRLVCGRYRTVGSAKPDAKGNYSITFKSTAIRGVAFYRAESKVLRKPGSKVYVIQYARAIAIKTTSQTG